MAQVSNTVAQVSNTSNTVEVSNEKNWAICTEWKGSGIISDGPYYFTTKKEAMSCLKPYHYMVKYGDPNIKSVWLQQEGNDQRFYYQKLSRDDDDVEDIRYRYKLYTGENI